MSWIRHALTTILLACMAAATSFASFDDGSFFSGSTCEIRREADGWILINDNVERRLVLDASGLRTTSIIKKPENFQILTRPVSEGSFTVDGVRYDLAHGWTLHDWQASEAGLYRQLTVRMRRPATPWVVTLDYRIYRGTRFWIRKEISFDFGSTHTLSDVDIEMLALPAKLWNGWYYEGENGIVARGGDIGGAKIGVAVFTNAPRNGGYTLQSADPAAGVYSLSPRWRHRVSRRVFGGIASFSLYFTGTKATAQFAVQLCVASAHAHGHPWLVPPLFMTWYAYGSAVTERDCTESIPIAARLGCELFLLDDGWQQNATQNGAYGDWLYHSSRFPTGLGRVASTAKSYGMRFGFWFSPSWSAGSRTRADHPEWVVKTTSAAPHQNLMCHATAWTEAISNRIGQVIRDTGASFVKLDFESFYDGCLDSAHGHPSGAALGEQHAGWQRLITNLRTVEPRLSISRAQSKATLNDLHDMGWENDWTISSRVDNPARFDPRQWYFSADFMRAEYWSAMKILPGFSTTATVPAHIAGLESRLDLLEYCIVSASAMFGNLEISNTLIGITPEEEAVARKWIRFNREMRPWLAYTQTIRNAFNPVRDWMHVGNEWVDAVWHLRPMYRGRYGFLVAFNPRSTQQSFTASIEPGEYFIAHMNPAQLRISALNPAGTFVNESTKERLQLRLLLPGRSWQVLDIGTAFGWREGDVNGDGLVNDNDLTAVLLDYGDLPSGLYGSTDVTGDGSVDDGDVTLVLAGFG